MAAIDRAQQRIRSGWVNTACPGRVLILSPNVPRAELVAWTIKLCAGSRVPTDKPPFRGPAQNSARYRNAQLAVATKSKLSSIILYDIVWY